MVRTNIQIAKLSIQQTLADAKDKEKDVRNEPYMVALGLHEKHSLTFKDDSYIIKVLKITTDFVQIHTSNVHKEVIDGELVKKLYTTDVTLHINEALRVSIGYLDTISFWRIQLITIQDSSEIKN